MANDPAKNAAATQEHPYPPTMPPYAQPLGAAYPPGYPIYYAQPPDAAHGENANGVPPGPQYMIPFPAAPGMMYPYPPPPPGQTTFPQYQQPAPAATNGPRPKRKQVKMACTNCANACKRCDDARPCERCVKYGIQETCMDGVRKERQKGIKRGPYKRKNKSSNSATGASFVGGSGESDWQATNGNPPAPGAQPPPPIQAIPHYPPPPEGFYPYFYPPPPGFIPPGHEGQSPPEGVANGASHPPPMVPYYPIAPPGFFPHYASIAPGAFSPPANGAPATTIDPAEASKDVGQSGEGEGQTNGTVASGKKRSRAGKGEAKSKKQKAVATAQESPASGGTTGGSDHTSEPGVSSPTEHDD